MGERMNGRLDRVNQPRPRLRRLGMVGTLVAVMSITSVLPVRSTAAAPSINTAGQEEGRRVRNAAIQRVTRARQQVAAGRLADVVLATARLGDVAVVAPAVVPLPVPAGVSTKLASPVGQLLGAISVAETLARSASRPDVTTRTPLEAQRALAEALAISSAANSRPDGRALDLAQLEQLGAEIGQGVDRGKLFAGSLALARTLDATLPALGSYAATLPASAARVTGCDVVNLPPALCIGGMSANTYVDDYVLQLDLGGNDMYANSAGGADLQRDVPQPNPGAVPATVVEGIVGAQGVGLAVSVAVDLQGNDLYRTSLPTKSGARIAQGSGYGGIGILLDAAGNDRYEITATNVDQSALGQGTGYRGVGLLVDGAGADAYLLSASNKATGAAGQAYASAGAAMLVDRDRGNDTFRVLARPNPIVDKNGAVRRAPAIVNGLGIAVSGAALFSDGGGTDVMELTARSVAIASDDPRPVAGVGGITGRISNALGGGFAVLGDAVALAGDGPTNWSLVTETSAPETGQMSTNGFGYAGFPGSFAALDDSGGADSYTMKAISRAARSVQASGAGTTPGAVALARGGFGDPSFAFPATVIYGMGHGLVYGVGLLRDTSGNDRYDVTSLALAQARARDARTSGQPNARATADAGQLITQAQGVGIAGFGLFDDGGGNDSYRVITTHQASANATATRAGGTLVGRALTGFAEHEAQAVGLIGGYGTLRDADGIDRYESSVKSSALASPRTEQRVDTRLTAAQADILFNGDALLLDSESSDAADVFVTQPSNPTCYGVRGQALWLSCEPTVDSPEDSAHLGVGRND